MRRNQNTRRPPTATPRYTLSKGLGLWELTFAGQHAVLKHEQGIYYVAWLLTHTPREPIHGLALTLKAAALYGERRGISQMPGPLAGEWALVGQETLLQERSLGLDDIEAAGALRRRQLQLEAMIEDESTVEPVRFEVQRELEAIYAFQKNNPGRTRDAAQKAVRAVRAAITRLQRHLASSVDAMGAPHPVLVPFAAHLLKHLLVPSSRYARRVRGVAGVYPAGCFVYEPPVVVIWNA